MLVYTLTLVIYLLACVSYTSPFLYMQATEISQAKIEYIQAVYDIMERFFKETPYICGDDNYC